MVVVPLYNPARLAAEIATADALSNGRLTLGIGAGYQPYEFERFGVDLKQNLEMTNEFCDNLDLAFSREFFSYHGKHYQMPDTHIPARPVQNPIPIYIAGHTEMMFRAAARHGYRALTSGRVGGVELLKEQYADIVRAFAAENVPVAKAHIKLNRFAHITTSRDEGMRLSRRTRATSRGSGGGVAAASYGLPDLGMTSLDNVLEDVHRITYVTELPLLVDIDTGWGSAFNIARTFKQMVRAGAAGAHIEDQVLAKRCGHRPGKAIGSKEEMVDRVKAAVDARTDDFVIMARTDALAVEGIDSAIERAIACVEAGADRIFPEAMRDLDQYRQFVAAVNVPVLANITEFGYSKLNPEELGFLSS